MPVIRQKKIQSFDLHANPTVLYLFGDNDQRAGYGGQAREVRGFPNAVGVRTKRAPTLATEDFWSDKTLEENKAKIDEDLAPVKEHLKVGGIVIVPADGIGTGLASLREHAPRTFSYLEGELMKLVEISVGNER